MCWLVIVMFLVCSKYDVPGFIHYGDIKEGCQNSGNGHVT